MKAMIPAMPRPRLATILHLGQRTFDSLKRTAARRTSGSHHVGGEGTPLPQKGSPSSSSNVRVVLFDNSSSINDFLFTFDLSTGNIYGPIFVTFAFVLGTLGSAWWYLLVLFVTWGIVLRCYRQTRRKHEEQLFTLQTALQDPDLARRIMGPYLPSWVTFAHVERGGWVQDLLHNMWQHIATASAQSTQASLNPLLEYYRPKMLLSSLTLAVCEFGTIPPVIDGVETHCTDKETMVDFRLRWFGNPDLRIIAKGMGLEVEVCVSNLQFQALMRVSFGPHCTEWPCFANCAISFVGKPVVDFDLRAAKIPLEAIPGLASWLDGFLRYTLALLLVYPKRMVFPMLSQEKMNKYGRMLDSTADPVGRLTVRIIRAEGLPRGFVLARRTYVEGTRTNGDPKTSVTKRTNTALTRNPTYENCMTFTVYNAPNERMELTLKSDDRKPPLVGNFFFKDDIVGGCSVFVAQCIEKSMEHRLRLVNPLRTTAQVGYITFSTSYQPFVVDIDDHGNAVAMDDDTLTAAVTASQFRQQRSGGMQQRGGSKRPSMANAAKSVMTAKRLSIAGKQPSLESTTTRNHSSTSFGSTTGSVNGSPRELDDSEADLSATLRSPAGTAHETQMSALFAGEQDEGDDPLAATWTTDDSEHLGVVQSHPLLRRSTLIGGKTIAGLLMINLISCDNLPKVDVIGSADPYVKFRLNHQMVKTEHIRDTLKPVYNQQFQLDILNVLRDALDVEVHDWDQIKINKRLMGKVSIPLLDVVKMGGTMRPTSLPLEPKGTITLGLKVMLL